LKRWEAKEEVKSLIAEDLRPHQTAERQDPETTFGWFVKCCYLPREGYWHIATPVALESVRAACRPGSGAPALPLVTIEKPLAGGEA